MGNTSIQFTYPETPQLISIVIPTYNSADTLLRAIEAAQQQTYTKIEILVVDDGSNDNTQALMQDRSDLIYIRQENQGPSAARNTGIAHAKGQYIAFLDADDTWAPEKSSLQMKIFQERGDMDLVACQWVRQGGEPDHTADPFDGESLPLVKMISLNQFQTSTVLAKRKVFETVGGFNSAYNGAEDWEMWLRISTRFNIWRMNAKLVIYYDMPTGYSKNLNRVYETMLAMLKEYNPEKKNALTATLTPSAYHNLMAWHHLRFAVGFYLNGEKDHAVKAVRQAQKQGLGAFSTASVTRLLPFLYHRFRQKRRPK